MKTSDLIETTNLFSLSEAKRVGKATRNLQNRINKFGKPWDDQPLNTPQPQDPQTDSVMNFVPGNDINTPQQTAEPATPVEQPVQATAPVQADTTTTQKKPSMWANMLRNFSNRGYQKVQATAQANSKFFVDSVYKQWVRDSVGLQGASPQEYNENLTAWLDNKWGANGQLEQFIQTAVQKVNPANPNTVYAAIKQVVEKNALVQNTSRVTPRTNSPKVNTEPEVTNTAGQDTLQSLSQRVDNLEKAMASQGSLVENNFSAILWNKK